MNFRRWLRFLTVAVTLVAGAVGVVLTWPQASVSLASGVTYPKGLRQDYSAMVKAVHDFENKQRTTKMVVVSPSELDGQLSLIQIDAASGHFSAAHDDISSLRQALVNWNIELRGGLNANVPAGPAVASGMTIPILLYHYPPPNFDQQLSHLAAAGYTVIDMDQVEAGLHGAALPPKPVVITFDDGFAVQMQAFDALKRHNMKATFYIIVGGEASKWCIGAGRRYNDPLQPPSGCGDAYLTWDQVRMLDKSGLITIAGHTINHRNLASLSLADQQFEIQTGKTMLEAELGHKVLHFAYPYGAYNQTSIAVAQAAGYLTAVTTLPGDIQPAGSDYTLRRVRDAMVLP